MLTMPTNTSSGASRNNTPTPHLTSSLA